MQAKVNCPANFGEVFFNEHQGDTTCPISGEGNCLECLKGKRVIPPAEEEGEEGVSFLGVHIRPPGKMEYPSSSDND